MIEPVSHKVSSDTYYAVGSFSCAKDGYRPLGIVGHLHGSGANFTFPRLYISNGAVYFTLTETERTPWTNDMTITVWILYEKV